MKSFEKIHVAGFRRLSELDIILKPLNVVIGANGCGKTSLLDVLSLLAASASGTLKGAMSEMSGIDANLSSLSAMKGGKARGMSFDLAMMLPRSSPIEYRIAMAPQGTGYEISEESLVQQWPVKLPPTKYIEAQRGDVRYFEGNGRKKGLVRPNWDYDSSESALSQVPKMYQEPEAFRRCLASSTHYHVLDVGPRAPIRLPQPLRNCAIARARRRGPCFLLVHDQRNGARSIRDDRGHAAHRIPQL